MSPDSFATGMDYLLERSVEIGMNGVSFGEPGPDLAGGRPGAKLAWGY